MAILNDFANQAISDARIGLETMFLQQAGRHSGGSSLPRMWNLQRTYMWDVFLPDLLYVSGLAVNQYCQDVSFGDYSVANMSSVRVGPFKSNFVGSLDIDAITLKFLQPVPDIVSAYFTAWRELCITREGYYNVKSKYAKDMYVLFYSTSGQRSEQFRLVGTFPKAMPKYTPSYSAQEIATLTVELNVDRVFID